MIIMMNNINIALVITLITVIVYRSDNNSNTHNNNHKKNIEYYDKTDSNKKCL